MDHRKHPGNREGKIRQKPPNAPHPANAHPAAAHPPVPPASLPALHQATAAAIPSPPISTPNPNPQQSQNPPYAQALGCGNPTALAQLKPGETVLDLGSGGGIDVLLSARRVGPARQSLRPGHD